MTIEQLDMNMRFRSACRPFAFGRMTAFGMGETMKLLGFDSALAVCVLTAAASAGPIDDLILPRGGDLLAANGTIHVNIGANALCSGSAAFVGDVVVEGTQIGTLGPYEVGTTSAVFERRSIALMPLPQVAPSHVRLKLSDIRLVGSDPITVAVSGSNQEWLVSATVSSSPAAQGYYELLRTSSAAGTFTATIPVQVRLEFEGKYNTAIVDAGTVSLTTTTGTWTTVEDSHSATLAIGGMPLGVALSGTLSSAVLDLTLEPAEEDGARPGAAYVDPTADIDENVASIGRYCSIGQDASVGAGVVVGGNAVIAGDATVGVDVVVGDWASIGKGCTIGDRAVVSSHAVLGSGCVIGSDVVINDYANIGEDCIIASGATIGERSVVRDNCVIGAGASVGARTQMGAGTTVDAQVEIAADARVAPGASISQSIVNCYKINGGSVRRALPVSGWPESPAVAIQQDSGMPSIDGDGTTVVTDAPVDPSNPPLGYGQLSIDVGSNIARPGDCGGTGFEYTPGGPYVCNWYADQLGQKLSGLGYTTTFTVRWFKNPDYAWWKIWSKPWGEGHALTDVHWPNGTTTWIEAQWSGAIGAVDAPTAGLDGNHDGSITHYDNCIGSEATDGNARIAVFNSRAEAVAAGVSCPGN